MESEPAIALVGGTLIDVSSRGHSTRDIANAVVVVRRGKVEAVGSALLVKVPKDAKKVDCSGTYILPGLVDGFGGLNSQAQANAWLYMGVTTIVGLQDERRGMLKRDAHPSPHIYPFDGAGFIDRYSLLFSLPQWRSKVKEGEDVANLNEQETKDQIQELARNGTRVIWLGQELTPEQTKLIVKEGHKLGLVTYGEFISTRYSDALQDGIDVLLHMSRYELGLFREVRETILSETPTSRPSRSLLPSTMFVAVPCIRTGTLFLVFCPSMGKVTASRL